MDWVRPLVKLSDLPLMDVGGKAANLARLVEAGLPVPDGFVVLTSAYRYYLETAGLTTTITRALASLASDDPEHLAAISRSLRAEFTAPLPGDLAAAIAAAYEALGSPIVAVRSSATAEDLPAASFAGQQDTYLNVHGPDAVLDAVRRCWASLWTDRAIAYRRRQGIAPDQIALAVVVQKMVDADVAGILFTADPVSGHRGRSVVEAAWGLGEAVVSGQVTPDTWTIETDTGRIVRADIGTKAVMTVRGDHSTRLVPVPEARRTEPSLTAAQLRELVALGQRIQAVFGSPQDIEWAWAQGAWYILQARPITTLFPLPEPLPPPDAGLRLYITLQGMQGVIEPLTPATLSFFRTVEEVGRAMLGFAPRRQNGPARITSAAFRLFVDVTDLIQWPPIRQALTSGAIDAALAEAVQDVLARTEIDREIGSRRRLVLSLPIRLIGFLGRVLWRAIRAWRAPDAARQQCYTEVEAAIARLRATHRRVSSTPERLAFVTQAIGTMIGNVIARTVPLWLTAMVALQRARRECRRWEIDPKLLTAVEQAVPHNPTTQMGLALWRLSREFVEHPEAIAPDHPAVQQFLARWGFRAPREIDLGVPRWREDPTPLLQMLFGYLRYDPAAPTPETTFQDQAAQAEAVIATLADRMQQRRGPRAARRLRSRLLRYRALAGIREWHKFYAVQVLDLVRQTLLAIGGELVRAGRLAEPDDVFFLTLTELASGDDFTERVRQRRADYEREHERRRIPWAMTSAGEVAYGVTETTPGTLRGLGASPGVYEGVARVMRTPTDGTLAPGEILVAPATDPAWTPLFLTAGAVVTETGGLISHGAVVAREYGIPAVVGVFGATEHIRTGDHIRVDGFGGAVTVLRHSNTGLDPEQEADTGRA